MFTPTEAAVVAAFYALMVALFIHREMRVPEIYGVLLRAAKTTSIVMFLCAGAQVASYMITLADLPNVLTAWLGPLVESPRLLMAVMMIVLVMIGTALDLTPTILIFAPVMLPIAVKAGIDPVYFGLMFVLNGAIGLITPPVGTVLNVVAGVGASRCTASSRGEPVPVDLRADPGAAGGLSADRDRAGALDALTTLHALFPVPFFPLPMETTMKLSVAPCWPPCRWLLCCLVPGRCPGLQAAHHPLRLRAQRGFQPGPRHQAVCRRGGKSPGGKMRVRAIGAAALGSDLQMQQALIGGAQEMMVAPPPRWWHHQRDGDLGHAFPVQQRQRGRRGAGRPRGPEGDGQAAGKGPGGPGVLGERFSATLTNSKRPVNKLEDMDGIKLRVMQNNVFLDSFKTLAPTPCRCRSPELFTALETKTVDGQENPTTPSCRASSMRCRSTSR